MLHALLLHSTHMYLNKTIWREIMHVHSCEEPRWNVNGPLYQGGLGWLHATWLRFRAPWMPMWANLATVREQVIAMARFVHVYGMPDLRGCRAY